MHQSKVLWLALAADVLLVRRLNASLPNQMDFLAGAAKMAVLVYVDEPREVLHSVSSLGKLITHPDELKAVLGYASIHLDGDASEGLPESC